MKEGRMNQESSKEGYSKEEWINKEWINKGLFI